MAEQKDETVLTQLGNRRCPRTGAVSAPVYFSTSYRHEGFGQSTGYDYTRTKNPTRDAVEEAIAVLEEGARGLAFSSGMAAIQAVLSLFRPGDEIIASSDLYGGTYRLFEQYAERYGLRFRYGQLSDLDTFASAVTEKTKAVFLESPTNPLMQEADLHAFADFCNAKRLLLIVDNTFYTPLLQKPIRDGADIVIHSATKYLGGHNDVLAGLVVTAEEALGERLAEEQNATGAVLAPFDSWLLMRGMKTLALRLERHEKNARRLSETLAQHPDVRQVLYPNRGGMLSFRLRSEALVPPFLQNLSVISFAESLGGVESFITHPATQTHADIPEAERLARGIDGTLLRFSVGIEHADDLIWDIETALSKAAEEVGSRGGK